MTDKQIIIDGKECRYWFRPNPDDYRKCALRGKDDNCDEIKDCYIKELLGKLALKEQECEELKRDNSTLFNKVMETRKENEKLKNEIEACYNQVEDFDIIATSKSNKLKQAEQKLGQIRVIAFHTCDKTDKNDPCYKILQIIGEVE